MLSRFSRALAVLALATLPLAFSSNASAQSRIAVVDVQTAVMQTEDGIRAQATLKKLFDKSQRDLDAKQDELQRAREDIERQARVLSREALARRTEDWQRRMVELQTLFVDYNKQLQKKQNELTGPILKKMMGIIARIAKKNGYDVIIDRSATPFARQDLDLTEQVVQMYNSGGGGGGDAPAEGGGDKPAEGGGDKPAAP
ncbi:MAG TPA: OmpH family outer membrane protein [Polyangium sp.]|nr:OmpH family outer membrane protein [Polyangium sp.]